MTMRALGLKMWGGGLLLLVGGCHLMFGDFEVDTELGDVGANGSGGEEGTGSCTSGAARCVGNVLQRCSDDGKAWDNAAVCASEALCDATESACLPPTCGMGEWRCVGAELQTCNGTRDGWITILTCATAGHCSAQTGTCAEVPCEAGDFQCSSAVLQACKDDRSGWDDVQACATPALCNADDGSCGELTCAAGEFRCDGAQLQTCTDTLDGWITIETCHSEALCDESNGECGAVACTNPGAFRCTDTGALERCSDDLTSWISVDVCESVAYCDAVQGVCTEEPCTPGELQCSGATLEVCNDGRTGWDLVETCETDGLCQLTLSEGSDVCEAPRCAEGDSTCEDAQPMICNASRTGFRDNGEACLTAALCTQGTCNPPTCDPGDTRCTDSQPEICNSDLTGYVANGDPCDSVALCNPSSGTCGDAKCVQGQMRCNPADLTELQRCASDLNDWDSCDTCATSGLCSASIGSTTTCDESSCQEPSCNLSDRWCGGSESRTLYQCPTSRINTQATVLGTCDAARLCDEALSANMTSCPTCVLTDKWCGGSGNQTLYKCPESRNNAEAIVLDVCDSNAQCEEAHSEDMNICPTCDLGDKWCVGAILYECPPSRDNSEGTELDTCATNALCEAARSADQSSCPDPFCGVGDTRCASTGNRTLQMCNSGRTGFTDCDTCASSQLCTDSLGATTCNADSCLVCLEDQMRCNGTALQVCNDTRTGWTTLATCSSAAVCTQSLTPAGQQTCDACLVGSTRCTYSQPEECQKSSSPADWVASDDDCGDPALCDATTGTCICVLDDTRCNSTTDNVDTCTSAGWTESEDCDGNGCTDGVCDPPAAEP